MAKEKVLVPDIGGAEAAEVVELLVQPGEQIDVEQPLIVLESDKASMEIPSTVAGTLQEMLVAEGDQLAEGAPIAWIETADAEAAESTGAGPGASVAAGEPEPAPEPAAAGASAPPEKEAAEPPAPAGDAATRDVAVPDIGTEDPVDLVEVPVAVGDRVEEGTSLAVLESDKASMEVPSPVAGEVVELLAAAGQTVREGDLLLRLSVIADHSAAAAGGNGAARARGDDGDRPQPREAAGAGDDAAPAAAGAGGGEPQAASEPMAPAPARGVYAGPAVRKLAREFGIDLSRVTGSGPRGRLLKEDLQAYVKQGLAEGAGPAAGGALPAVPEVDFSVWGPVALQPRSKLDKLTAANMQRSWLNAPHVTQFEDADVTDLEAFRQSLKAEAVERGTRLTPLPFLLKACAVALRRHPRFNASLAEGGSSLVLKDYVHIGMAVDTPAGLVVPVLRDVDRKALWELADEVLALAEQARDRKLKPADMQGGCFTVSSLGGLGGRGFTPIINTPEVGILGVGRADVRPVWDGNDFQPRTMMPLALSYDHRVINGAEGGRFLATLTALLTDVRRLLL